MTLRQLTTAIDVSEQRVLRENKLRALSTRMGMADKEDFEKFMKDSHG